MSHENANTGSCLCGAVTLRTTSKNRKADACHCRMCRTWGGGPFLGVDCGGPLEILGEENVTVFDSSKWAERGFCSRCGTHLFYRRKGANHYSIPAGLLVDESGIEMECEIFIDEKPDYYSFSNDIPKLTGAEAFATYEQE